MMTTEDDSLEIAEQRLVPENRHYAAVVLLVIASWLISYGSVYMLADNVPAGAGYPKTQVATYPFFRFDAVHYEKIVVRGYEYDGDLRSSPNIVFLPAFPLLVRALARVLPGEAIMIGTVLNHLLFLAACLILFKVIHAWFGTLAAFVVTCGLCFSPGSFFFHAFYSESLTMVLLALCLYFFQKRIEIGVALAACLLCGCRTIAGPLSLTVAIWFTWHSWKAYQEGDRKTAAMRLILAPISLGGAGAYLLYIWVSFGNPFVLLPQIQMQSWEFYHERISLWEMITFKHMFIYSWQAIQRGGNPLTDIKTVNLVMTLIGVAASFHVAVRGKHLALRLGFPLYMAMIYYSSAGSDYLMSTYRYMTPMLPIYLMATDLLHVIRRRWGKGAAIGVGVGLLGLSITQMVILALHFTQGQWFYF